MVSSSSSGFKRQVVEGVAFLHTHNVLHRDLKPQNVFLFRSTPASDGLRAVVGDFGSSKTLSSTAALAQTVVGSPLYMSPELLESEPHGTPTDIWSLGCLLYELLTGQPPFRAPSYPAVVRKITRGEYLPLTVDQSGDKKVRELVDWMLQRDPSKRPTAEELLASLASAAVLGSDDVPVAKPMEPSASSTTSDPTTVVDNHDECYGIDDVVILPPPAPVPRQPLQVSSSEASGDISITSLPPQDQHAGVLTLPADKRVAETRSNVLRQQQEHLPLHPMQRNRYRDATPVRWLPKVCLSSPLKPQTNTVVSGDIAIAPAGCTRSNASVTPFLPPEVIVRAHTRH
jgi:serine/threonine protein kinase